MIRVRGRRFIVLLVFVGLLGGCARPGVSSVAESAEVPSGLGASRSATVVKCPRAGVRVEVEQANAAMGLRVLGIVLVNCGSRAYRLSGYPVMRCRDDHRKALKVRILHGVKEIVGSPLPWDGPPEPVVLKPGQRAGAAVAWRNTYDDSRKPPVTVRFLDIAPRAGRGSQVVDVDGGLDLGSTGRIAVSAWRLVPDGGATRSPGDRPGPSAAQPAETVGPLA